MTKWIPMFLACFCGSALAVEASHWKQTSAADFESGELDGVVATNFGDLKLSRQVTPLLEQDPTLSAVYCLAEAPDGTIYAGTGPDGVLLAVKDRKVSKVLTLKNEQNIFSLLIDDKGRLLLGTGGERGRILRLDPAAADKKPVEIFSSDKAQYVWAMARAGDGTIYAATGPNGHLFAITPEGKSSVLFKCNEGNLLSMISDGKETLYVGTDPNGLVYRINRRTGEAFILLDADETEVSALALDSKGNLFAATGQAAEREMAKADAEATAEKIGRPESGGISVPPIPPAQPKDPDPKPATKPTDVPKTLMLLQDDPEGGDAPAGPSDSPRRQPGGPAPATHEGSGNPSPGRQRPRAAQPPAPPANGNAIYRIEPEGFVTEVFRTPEMILSLLERGGVLLAGTGSDGNIYEVNPLAEETVIVAKVEAHEILCLLPGRDGQVYMGMANLGGLSTMSRGHATKGTYTSEPLDATQISRFGKLQIRASLPGGTAVKVSTRSGNVRDAAAEGWSAWTDDLDAARFQPIKSPAARFLQYRLTLTSDKGDATPIVDEVDAAYQMPNLAPRVTAIQINSAESAMPVEGDAAEQAVPHGTRVQTISWTTEDANRDALASTLWFRTVPDGEWIMLKEKLTAGEYAWDTRTAADGRYEVKVEASDAAANPAGTGKSASRVSDPVVVDNTPPEILNLLWQKQPRGAKITFAASDKTSTIAAIAYAVDSARDWQAVLPSDSICDELQEPVAFEIGGLAAGKHQVAVRVTDAAGNRSYQTVTIDVPAK